MIAHGHRRICRRICRLLIACVVLAALSAPALADALPLRVLTIVATGQPLAAQDRLGRVRQLLRILVGNPFGCVLGLVVPTLDPLDRRARRPSFRLRPVRFDSGAGFRASLAF